MPLTGKCFRETTIFITLLQKQNFDVHTFTCHAVVLPVVMSSVFHHPSLTGIFAVEAS
jgi:hypothetical protein